MEHLRGLSGKLNMREDWHIAFQVEVILTAAPGLDSEGFLPSVAQLTTVQAKYNQFSLSRACK